MTSIGTGYDLSASTYSPDGRIFQASLTRLKYMISVAEQAYRSSTRIKLSRTQGIWSGHPIKHQLTFVFRTAIGLRVKDGIVLAVEKLIHSKLLIPEANRRIQSVDRHIGIVCRTCSCCHDTQMYITSGNCWLSSRRSDPGQPCKRRSSKLPF